MPKGRHMMRTVLSALALLAVESAALRLPQANRREMFKFAAGVPAIALPAVASAAADSTKKRTNLSPLEMAAAVKADITERQFLVTGQLSRDLYDESCMFKDEIDTYTLDKWIKGTSALFVGSLSHVDIVGEVEATDAEVRFRFDEVLAFNFPLIKPKVPLTGTLVLTRGKDGLITDYNEIWDTDVATTLSKAYL